MTNYKNPCPSKQGSKVPKPEVYMVSILAIVENILCFGILAPYVEAGRTRCSSVRCTRPQDPLLGLLPGSGVVQGKFRVVVWLWKGRFRGVMR